MTGALVIALMLLSLVALGLGRTVLAQPGVSYTEMHGGDRNSIVLLDIEHRLRVSLTDNRALNFSGAWSPDGTRMVFLLVTSDGTLRLSLLIPGGGVRLLDVGQMVMNTLPVWSPDGKSVVYGVMGEQGPDLAVIDVDAPLDGKTNPRLLVKSQKQDGFPAWSPDGAQIAFVSWRSGDADIYLSSADGGRIIPLTDNPGEDVSPAWSPDGSKIAYFSLRGTYRQLWIMNRDGSGARQLTNTLDVNSGEYWRVPVWSPDGLALAYQNVFDGIPKIVVSRVDGSGERRLTEDVQFEDFPRWLPGGDRLVYLGRSGLDTGIFVVSTSGGSGEALTPDGIQVGSLELWRAR